MSGALRIRVCDGCALVCVHGEGCRGYMIDLVEAHATVQSKEAISLRANTEQSSQYARRFDPEGLRQLQNCFVTVFARN